MTRNLVRAPPSATKGRLYRPLMSSCFSPRPSPVGHPLYSGEAIPGMLPVALSDPSDSSYALVIPFMPSLLTWPLLPAWDTPSSALPN